MSTKKVTTFEIYQEMSRRAKINFHKFLTTVGLPHNYFDTDYTTIEQKS